MYGLDGTQPYMCRWVVVAWAKRYPPLRLILSHLGCSEAPLVVLLSSNGFSVVPVLRDKNSFPFFSE